ncbi:tetratricopeptide repeat protein [Marinactinospora thermotolerans]|uniref:Tetratricopeptide repeat-containing protein n=1 Tax=Marinactinospora thermotolerans DSM 45154 TaxID=1122192 RepID=A0A1T4SND0_9ACTN|nr:tetratricopeptide repeat protein [Marinactinospora thermotolerans]SKA29418.1 Tetratricopeptide repeat-containing protein [Marinactinospora thermotolerans DSM 45154]
MAETSYDTFARGRRFFNLGDPIGAARVLAPLAEAEPNSRSVLELLGRSYFHSAQLAKAEETFRRLVELDPCDAWAHIALARTLERQNRESEAAPHRRMHGVMSGGSLD